MQWLILPLVGITGGLIFYQDLKTRSVTWLLFPIIAVCGLFYAFYYSGSLQIVAKNFAMNIGFLLLQFLLLKIILTVKRKQDTQPEKKIGWGDILFLLACALFFSPANFIVFYFLSLVFSLLFHFLFKLISKKNYCKTIPLAGFQALFLFMYIFLNEIVNNNLVTDDWIVFYLSRI